MEMKSNVDYKFEFVVLEAELSWRRPAPGWLSGKSEGAVVRHVTVKGSVAVSRINTAYYHLHIVQPEVSNQMPPIICAQELS